MVLNVTINGQLFSDYFEHVENFQIK